MIESLTAPVETDWVGKIVLKLFCSFDPTAFASEQPASVARLSTVSPRPRAMSFASASRLVSMNAFVLAVPPAVSVQLLVPLVIPNVWLPNVPFVVAASTGRPLPKKTEPSPQPARPYFASPCAAGAAGAALSSATAEPLTKSEPTAMTRRTFFMKTSHR